MKHVLIILGTRPEAIKLAPILLQLKKHKRLKGLLCNTEQQKELSNQTLHFFGLQADFSLNVMRKNQALPGLQARLLERISAIFKKYSIDAVVVQGDTMSVLCGALVGFYHRVPVFHVEAGLRSYDLFEPFPEEAIRQMTSRISTFHFAPTQRAKEALLKEDIKEKNILVTGNTGIDALYMLPSKTIRSAQVSLRRLGVSQRNLILITVHRRENHGKRLEAIIAAIKKLAFLYSNYQFVIPVHPNPNVCQKIHSQLGQIKNILLCRPLDYPELVCLMESSALILTDSGEIQEEAPSFGVPLLVLRYETERGEGVKKGLAKLVGAEEETIVRETSLILNGKRKTYKKQNPYGDGKAAQRIIRMIDKLLK